MYYSNSSDKSKVSTKGSSKEVSLNKRDTGVQLKISMAAETGNANIFGIVKLSNI